MSRYPELAAKVDAFFDRVMKRHSGEMACGRGCSHCCHVRLTVTSVEANAIRTLVSQMPEVNYSRLVDNVALAAPDRCAALTPGGLCLIYAARPIVCRSHGAPIRYKENSLPVIAACDENFMGIDDGPAGADPDCVIDQETLSAMLLAVDREAGGDGSRVDLAELLASL